MLGIQSTFDKGARVHAGGRVTLEEDLIPGAISVLSAEEMVLSDFKKCCGGSESRNVSAKTRVLMVRANHHGHRVPSNDALDTALDLAITRVGWLLFDWNCVDVGRVRVERNLDLCP